MDYKKSYTLLWVGLIAGFVLMLIGVFLEMAAVAGSSGCYGGCSPDAAVLPVSVLRRTLGSPGRHSPLLPGVWGVHSVKILSYWQNKAALRLQSGLAVVSNKRQLVRQDQGAASAAP